MSDTKEIIYRLIAEYDGETVFTSAYPDTSMLQEDGLRKAEYAIEQAIQDDEDEIDG